MSENFNTNDLLADLDAMYEAAKRRAEPKKWQDHYATGYSDGIWDARSKVREAVALEETYKMAYGKLNVELQGEREKYGSVVNQCQHLANELDGLVRLTDTIRELAEGGYESEYVSDWVYTLAEILRLLDGGDA